MAGYAGYSKSNNAVAAESEGKLPLTHAIKAVAAQAGITQKKAREILTEIGRCEWHHTSKKYNETDYYHVGAAVLRAKSEAVVAALEAANFEERINSLRLDPNSLSQREEEFRRISQELASEVGCSPELVLVAYYGTWQDHAEEVAE